MSQRRIAAFDFDGTLLKGDAVLPYLIAAGGARRAVRGVVTNATRFVAIKAGRGDRNEVKRRLVRTCLGGVSYSHAKNVASHFVSNLDEERLFPEVMKRLDWHKTEGHECVIVSASLDLYIEEFARKHDFDDVLCTRVHVDNEVLTGELVGNNVRADEKARLLELHSDRATTELWAYGNSRDDDAMLALADHAFRVDKHGCVLQEH